MVMPLVSEESGILRHNMIEGALLTAGDVIANLELDNPEAAKQVTVFEGSFPELGPPLIYSSKVDQKFKIALASAKNVMQGRHFHWVIRPMIWSKTRHSLQGLALD